MKDGIHPQVYDVVYKDLSSGAMFVTTSTKKSEETIKINGKDYYVLNVEITSDTHPFYTGKQKLIDTAGRVDKFLAKRKKAEALKAKNQKDEPAKDEEMKEEEPKKPEEPKQEDKSEEDAPVAEEVAPETNNEEAGETADAEKEAA